MIENEINILIADDEPDMLNGTAKLLKTVGYKCSIANGGNEAVDLLNKAEFDLVLCDLFMPDKDGFDVLNYLKKIQPNVPLIILSAFGSIDRAVDAIKKGAYDFIEKPFESKKLFLVIERALEHKRLLLENKNLLKKISETEHYENLIGNSEKMREIYSLIEQAAPSNANILISGESGTGKELVARAIHSKSKRAKGSFVPVNCSALPETLFEAELFGYEKGAFTGAYKKKEGLLEFASGGSFFMDEVFEMPASIQTKLLRVIQDKKIRRLGGTEEIEFDARIISASNINPDIALKEKMLREDFFYRINVVNIFIPPLRDRKEDINVLANYFLNQSLEHSEKTIEGIDDDVFDIFMNYSWPGNVRELENVIKRAVVLCRTNVIGVEDLPKEIRKVNSQFDFSSITISQAKTNAADKVEKDYILFLLDKCSGNVTEMSKLSGMTRRNLHRILNKHNLDSADWRETN